MDIDSPILNRFKVVDKKNLEKYVEKLNKYIDWNELTLIKNSKKCILILLKLSKYIFSFILTDKIYNYMYNYVDRYKLTCK